MANQIDSEKRRYTYAEFIDTFELLTEIAVLRRLDVSDIVREATHSFVQNNPQLAAAKKAVAANKKARPL